MSWMDHEPVRGSYPDPRMLGLPGPERFGEASRPYFPTPPIHHLFGLTWINTSVGSSIFQMPASPWLQSSAGVFLAGTAALVADAPLGGAIVSTLPPGAYGVTSDLSLNFLRPMTPASGMLTARARLIDAGRSLGLSEALVEDASGRVVAHATSRYFVLRMDEPPDPSGVEPIEPLVYDTPDPYQRPLTQPVLAPEIWNQTSGLDILLSTYKGGNPDAPCAVLTGARGGSAEEGRVTQSWPASEWFCSPARTIYGGVIAMFLDVVLTGAVVTTLPAGAICAPLDLKVNFLRPGFADGGELTATGTIVHRGRSLAVARGEILNGEGKVLATATSSMRIAENRSWGAFVPVDEPETEND